MFFFFMLMIDCKMSKELFTEWKSGKKKKKKS